MLKKLVKYGNSNALILDRSILALLDIREGSVVKLRIEGDSLIVKAVSEVKPTDLLMTEMESLDERASSFRDPNPAMEIAKKNARDFCDRAENDLDSLALLQKWSPGSENYQKLQDAYGDIFKKYEEELQPLATKEYQNELKLLNESYKKEKNSDAYKKDLLALRLKFSPKLKDMDKEMHEASLALGFPKELMSNQNN